MSSPQPRSPAESPRWISRIGWDKASIFVFVAVVLAISTWGLRRPLVLLAARMSLSGSQVAYESLRTKIANEGGPGYRRWASAQLASRAADSAALSADAAADEIQRLAGGDPRNGAYAFLTIQVWLRDESPSAAERFERVRPLLAAATQAPIDFGLQDIRAAWAGALAAELGDAKTGTSMAADLWSPSSLRLIRSTNDDVIRLGRALRMAGRNDDAKACYDAVMAWSRAAMGRVIDVSGVFVWADAFAGAADGIAILAAQRGDMAAADAAQRDAERARTFRNDLYQRLDADPVNALANGSAPHPTVVRRVPYGAAVRSLLTAGAAVAAMLVCFILCAFSATAAATARLISGTPASPASVEHGVWSWVGIAAVAIAPAVAFAVIMQIIPIDARYYLDTKWISGLMVLVAAGTMIAVRLAFGAKRWRSPVWRVSGTAVVILLIVAFIRPWGLYDGRVEWFEQSARTSLVVSRTWFLAVLASLVALGVPIAGLIVRMILRARGRSLPTGGSLKTAAVISAFAWMCTSGVGLLTVDRAGFYVRELMALDAADAQDGVAARMGPSWRETFATTPSG